MASEARAVGLIGLGLMGSVFAGRLIEAGYRVLGFDVDPGRVPAFEAAGGRAAPVAEIARSGAPIVLAVFDTDQVEQVVEGEILPALGEGSGRIVVVTSTCDPDRIEALAARVAVYGLRLLEAPVSGTSEQVRQGQGVGLVGGDAGVMEEVRPVLDALFRRCFHIGRVGDGGRAKLAVNLVLGLNRAALAEGLVFAERLGLDPRAFLAVARESAAYSQVMDTKGPKMVRGDFSEQGRARQTLKDVRLMLDQARKRDQELPLTAVNAELLEACVRQGEGDLDNSVVVRELRRRASRPGGAGPRIDPAGVRN